MEKRCAAGVFRLRRKEYRAEGTAEHRQTENGAGAGEEEHNFADERARRVPAQEAHEVVGHSSSNRCFLSALGGGGIWYLVSGILRRSNRLSDCQGGCGGGVAVRRRRRGKIAEASQTRTIECPRIRMKRISVGTPPTMTMKKQLGFVLLALLGLAHAAKHNVVTLTDANFEHDSKSLEGNSKRLRQKSHRPHDVVVELPPTYYYPRGRPSHHRTSPAAELAVLRLGVRPPNGGMENFGSSIVEDQQRLWGGQVLSCGRGSRVRA